MFTSSVTSLALVSLAWLPIGVRWEAARQPVPYCISANATRTSVDASAQRQAVLDGINVWVAQNSGGSLSCTSFAATNATFSCRVGVNLNDRRPNIFWERNWTEGPFTLGVTWSVPERRSCGRVTDDTGTPHDLLCLWDADIELNDVNYTWTTNGNSTIDRPDIASIVAHEYGHFIGLDHCDENNTCQLGSGIMFASYDGSIRRNPFTDDVQGACALYPGMLGGTGTPCTDDNQCSSNLCINVGGDRYCTQTCGSCPTGFRCAPNPNDPAQQVCLRDDGLNRDVCETCVSGAPNACVNGGLCVAGIPERDQGRCVEPCGPGDTCGDPRFRCRTVILQNGAREGFCLPRSSDCTDLDDLTELQIGQQCDGEPPCVDGLLCVGICAPECTGGLGCPSGYGCELLQGGRSFCLPEVREGESCEDLVSCSSGPCLSNPDTGQFQCYLDCAGTPGVCNNAQSCNTYTLQSGAEVSICEPPGVPPLRPDAGIFTPDADGPDASASVPDTGFTGPCNCDLTFDCDEDPLNPGSACACDPECNCACDLTFACNETPQTPCPCDPECNCGCDTTRACDQGCGCDPDCYRQSVTTSTCTCTTVDDGRSDLALFLAALAGVALFRRRRVR